MSHSSTLLIGMDVHKDSIAVASVAQAHGAEVVSLGTLGTRPCAIDQRLRQLPSQGPPLVFVYEAGPCGYWRSRDLTQKGDVCWVIAPPGNWPGSCAPGTSPLCMFPPSTMQPAAP